MTKCDFLFVIFLAVIDAGNISDLQKLSVDIFQLNLCKFEDQGNCGDIISSELSAFLSLELASDLCDYLNLDEDETDYFLLLVDYNRAGSHKLRSRFLRQIKIRQEKSKKLETRVKANELNDEARMVFYSSWVYQGIRMLADTGTFNDAESLSTRLNLPRNHVQKVLDFLIAHRLLIEEKNKLKLGPSRTYLPTSSPLISRHLQNWHIQATSKMHQVRDEDFFYSGPMALSEEVAAWVRQELPAFVQSISAKVIPSKSETVRCLNIDWFEY